MLKIHHQALRPFYSPKQNGMMLEMKFRVNSEEKTPDVAVGD